jgi:hypothetical protein
MATIARHRTTGVRYVVLGATHTRHVKTVGGVDSRFSIAVCDAGGAISFLSPHELVVLQVDGASPDRVLAEDTYR